MNVITAGGIFKTFGVIFSKVQAKYDVSAAILSWIPATTLGIAFIMGKIFIIISSTLLQLIDYLHRYEHVLVRSDILIHSNILIE